MNINDLKVGDKVYIREDLEHGVYYGGYLYIYTMGKGIKEVYSISKKHRTVKTVEDAGFYYSPEMIDWEKTIKLRRIKMKLKDLKAGDKVYIREDLEHLKRYGERIFVSKMLDGKQEIRKVDYDEQTFKIESEKPFAGFDYTLEMIDWDKTMKTRLIEEFIDGDVSVTSRNRIEEVKEEINKEFGYHDTVHNPSHYGGGGKHNIECYEAIEYILDKLEHVPNKYYGHVFNIVKYIWRCNDKNGYEDLDKASVYFDFMFREDD